MAVTEYHSGKNLFAPAAFVLGVVSLVALAILPRLTPLHHGLTSKPAPDFVLDVVANRAGDERLSISGLRGHPILLDFWGSFCGPCAIEAPVVDRIARRYRDRGLVVMGVNTSDDASVISAYARDKRLSYPMVADENGRVSQQYGVHQLPSLVIIDKQGIVRAFMVGIVDEATLGEIISSLL